MADTVFVVTEQQYQALLSRCAELERRLAGLTHFDFEQIAKSVEKVELKLHEFALTVAQDGNMHTAGEDRLHALFADGFAAHLDYVRPEVAPNDPAQEEPPEDKSRESEMAKLLKQLNLDSPEKLQALGALLKSEPGSLKSKAA